jgi:hypothetical protein
MKMYDKVPVNNQVIRLAFELKGIEVEKGELGVFGLRGVVPCSDGKHVQIVPNAFNKANDTIGLVGTAFRLFRGSVDPGATYTQRPLNKNGCAHLQLGKYRYSLGLHRGEHLALVQAGPVRIIRDQDKDGLAEVFEPKEFGHFGINIHAMGASPDVGPWSAGCQVIQGGWAGAEWQEFLGLLQRSGQRQFWYYGPLDADVLAEAHKQLTS